MTPTAKTLLGFLIAAFVVFAWLFRIDAKPTSNPLIAIVTNRWTGTVFFCSSGAEHCAQIYPK